MICSSFFIIKTAKSSRKKPKHGTSRARQDRPLLTWLWVMGFPGGAWWFFLPEHAQKRLRGGKVHRRNGCPDPADRTAERARTRAIDRTLPASDPMLFDRWQRHSKHCTTERRATSAVAPITVDLLGRWTWWPDGASGGVTSILRG